MNSLHALDKLNKPQALIKAAFELKLMCLEGYEPLLDACAVCGLPDPDRPRLDLVQGVLHCASCQDEVGEGVSLPLEAGTLAAMRHIVYGDPKRLFSFQLDQKGLDCLGRVCERFLLTQLDRGFSTLDFYKQLKAGM
ncbi:DNA repair protein RecO [Intestinimonas massiliensis (ex Afouda et al. 2020)]|uniref:DNA repair protein RecO n=1 Tax=Intestinimonas massiliensis (ex Afouda et al. 2020) TaxID=1673721 RepID=UPI001F5FEBC5|nr:DNA repair protein RecO C-terminal domain-containing protein [Intestinimonas massiliensis (ex Afouda et al. 2020)]